MKHLLVVDDEAAIRFSLRTLFEDVGYQVEEAANGQQALTSIQQNRMPQVVLLDLMMPVLDGFGVLTALFAQADVLRRLRLVLMTAGDGTFPMRIAQQIPQYGIRLVKKPFDINNLEALVDALYASLLTK